MNVHILDKRRIGLSELALDNQGLENLLLLWSRNFRRESVTVIMKRSFQKRVTGHALFVLAALKQTVVRSTIKPPQECRDQWRAVNRRRQPYGRRTSPSSSVPSSKVCARYESETSFFLRGHSRLNLIMVCVPVDQEKSLRANGTNAAMIEALAAHFDGISIGGRPPASAASIASCVAFSCHRSKT